MHQPPSEERIALTAARAERDRIDPDYDRGPAPLHVSPEINAFLRCHEGLQCYRLAALCHATSNKNHLVCAGLGCRDSGNRVVTYRLLHADWPSRAHHKDRDSSFESWQKLKDSAH